MVETLGDLIAKKRAAGYDAEFEARLARVWACPSCGHPTTIQRVLVPVGDPSKEFGCPRCGKEGIKIADDPPDLSVIAGGKK